MKFLTLNSVIVEEWDHLVLNSPDGWVFSLTKWITMITRVWSLEDFSFAVKENGKIVAVMPLSRLPGANKFVSTGFGYGGPCIVKGIGEKHRNRLIHDCLEHTIELASENGGQEISIGISPVNQTSLSNKWGVNPLLPFGFRDTSTRALIINLDQSLDEIWMSFDHSARKNINKAVNAGYHVKLVDWKDSLDDYYRIHSETYHRTNITPHPKAYFNGIKDMAPEFSKLMAGCNADGEIVAYKNTATFLNFSATAHTTCCQTDHVKSGVNSLMFWETIKYLKQNGYRWYEVGEVFPGCINGKEMALTLFKSQFGGELHNIFRGAYTLQTPQSDASGSVENKNKNEDQLWSGSRKKMILDWLRFTKHKFIKPFLMQTFQKKRKKLNPNN